MDIRLQEKVIQFKTPNGFGDSIYAYPFVMNALNHYERVHVTTPFPNLYPEDARLTFSPSATCLRFQKNNENENSSKFSRAWHKVINSVDLRYKYDDKDCFGSMQEKYNVETIFRLVILPEWERRKKLFERSIRSRKKIALVKFPTIRGEWRCPSRNPKMEYFHSIFDWLDMTTVSIADVADGIEWFDGELPAEIDHKFHNGSSLEELIGMVLSCDVVITAPCFLVPLSIALDKPCLCIFGGHKAPKHLVDARMMPDKFVSVAPEPFCNCNDKCHNCNKEISEDKLSRGLTEVLEAMYEHSKS